jgi:aspartyl-tRNA(Asn)/glutamyl-tRNA(Gln) amidotransferase subunit A
MKKKISPPSKELWKITLAEASARLQAASLSPVELLEAYLERIAEVDSKIHSYIYVAAEPARKAAKRAESELRSGIWKGPLHGIPFAVKDNYDVAGMPATAGSRLRLAHTPEVDAPLVADLKAAGAVLIGKLSTWEFGTGNGGEYFDLPFPPARNPWDVERFTGGSSTGAGAAVAAGTTLFALGSDTTGSVRLPAAACGAVGMITTPGRLSRPLCLDSTRLCDDS